jgi:hypothetical protein
MGALSELQNWYVERQNDNQCRSEDKAYECRIRIELSIMLPDGVSLFLCQLVVANSRLRALAQSRKRPDAAPVSRLVAAERVAMENEHE